MKTEKWKLEERDKERLKHMVDRKRENDNNKKRLFPFCRVIPAFSM